MTPFAWIASYVFLALSVCLGILIYMIINHKKKKKLREEERNAAVTGEEAPLSDLDELKMRTMKKMENLEELERRFKKRG